MQSSFRKRLFTAQGAIVLIVVLGFPRRAADDRVDLDLPRGREDRAVLGELLPRVLRLDVGVGLVGRLIRVALIESLLVRGVGHMSLPIHRRAGTGPVTASSSEG